jgi:hypothetical protein
MCMSLCFTCNLAHRIPFNRIHSTVSVYGGAAKENDTIQINRALSRANMVGIARVPNISGAYAAAGAANALESDYMRLVCKPSNPTSFQVKLGAEFFPNQPLVGIMPAFQTSQVAWGAFRGSMPNGVKPEDYYYRAGLISQTLEKSSTLSQSGVPIAANRCVLSTMSCHHLIVCFTQGSQHRLHVPRAGRCWHRR